MSVYKVISNYYTNILDTIHTAFNKNGKNYDGKVVDENTYKADFDTVFAKIDKIALLRNLTDIMVKLYRLQQSERGYWVAQKKTYVFYVTILWIIFSIITLTFIYFWKLKVKEVKGNTSELMRASIFYLIMILIMLTPILLLVTNLMWIIKQCNAQLGMGKTPAPGKINEDFMVFQDMLMSSKDANLLSDLLLYAGLIRTRKNVPSEAITIKNNLDNLLKQLQSDTNTSIKYKDTRKNDNSRLVSKSSLQNYLNIIEKLTPAEWNSLKDNSIVMDEIKENLRTFYDKGKGFYTLRVSVVSMSNILTLREMKRVMDFYYYMTMKQGDNQNVELTEHNTKKLIDEIIIDPINEKTVSYLIGNENEYLRLVDDISKRISPYQIDLSKHQKYFNEQLTKNNEQHVEFIKNIHVRLVKVINIKQKTSLKRLLPPSGLESARFYTPEEFIVAISDITFVDFKEGLEHGYLEEITSKFYSRITNVVPKSTDDIFFNSDKNKKVYEIFMYLFFTIICLSLGYYIVNWNDERQIMHIANAERYKQYMDKYATTRDDDQNKRKMEYSLKRLRMKYATNLYIKLLIPLVATFFFMSMIYSYYVKKQEVIDYNKGILEDNTLEFQTSIKNIRDKMDQISFKITTPLKRIGDIEAINDADKFELFNQMKIMIDRFEKCNFMMEAAKNKLPFPYIEITTDVFMICILVGCLLYITTSFKPVSKLRNLRKLRGQKEIVENSGITSNGKNDTSLIDELAEDEICHENEVDSIMFTLKIIFFIFVFVFLLFYSTKVLNASADFRQGIYNSGYFDQNKCYGD